MKRRSIQCLSLCLTLSIASYSFANGETPPPLTGVAIPPTPGLLDGDKPIVVNKTAAIQLGKALFWDTNLGSDGMACASCHFHAGVDNRVINQLSPGSFHPQASGKTFESTASGQQGGVNYSLNRRDFPTYQLTDPKDKKSKVLFYSDDIVSSAGVFNRQFKQTKTQGSGTDECNLIADPIFHAGTLNTRQGQPRHTPGIINAAFNFRNFWDGRANNIFNGVSPYGARDADARVWELQANGTLTAQILRLENASLASQAVAPPLNSSEMSCSGRQFSDIARKLLTRRPLEWQKIHFQDSVLANLIDISGQGLNITYEQLIKTAFASRYWAANDLISIQNKNYRQIEINFALFLGLAIQLYEQTLIADQTPFDQPRIPNTYPLIPKGFNAQQIRGLKVFLDAGCNLCHKGPNLSAASHPELFTIKNNNFASLRLINRHTLNGSFVGKGVIQGLLDEGYFSTSVVPAENDSGVGGKDIYGYPLSFSQQFIQRIIDGTEPIDPVIMNSCDLTNSFVMDYLPNELKPDPYIKGNCANRQLYAKIPFASVLLTELAKNPPERALIAVNGAFKIPTLRNIELTGPYMHNGSLATLEQVIDFYFRGGNFNNFAHFAAFVFQQPITPQQKTDLVVFLKSLTDERVRWERAPFDHPELKVPHGHRLIGDKNQPQQAQDLWITIPAIGQNGRDVSLGPLKAFQRQLKP
ncbi:MAG: hypothetical protein RL637_166 [Pseudomonadota bacterium]|jgi:cytochrome c peroxidase